MATLAITKRTVDAAKPAAADDARQARVGQLKRSGAGWFGRDRLVLQVRYKDPKTGEIDSVEPDRPLSRRRVKRPLVD